MHQRLLLDTRADIARSAPDPSVVEIETRGFYKPNDGGHAKFTLGNPDTDEFERTANGRVFKLFERQPDVLQFGAPQVTGAIDYKEDATPGFNRALKYCEQLRLPILTVGKRWGVAAFLINGELDYIRHNLKLEGAGSAATTIYATGPMRKGRDQGLFTFSPTLDQSITGAGLEGLGIIGLSTQARQDFPGAAISCLAGKDYVIGRQIFRDVYVSKDVSSRLGDWLYDVYMDGGLSRSPGIRGNDFYSCHLFGVRAEGWAIYCRSGAFKFIGGSTVVAGGVHGGIYITGGDANHAPPSISEGIDFMGASISGPLKMDNTRLSTINANSIGSIDIAATCASSTIRVNEIGYPFGGGTVNNRSRSTNIYKRGVLLAAAA